MKTKNKIFWVIFITILIVLIYTISVNSDSINYFIKANVKTYGYPAIFLFCFLDDTIDQPIVPEIPAILGVVYGLDVLFVFLIGSLGLSYIGLINFNIGRKVFKYKIEEFCSKDKNIKYYKLFQKYGKWSLLIAALTPVPYVTFVWLSGAFGMKFKTFFVFGMLGKVFRLGFALFITVIVLQLT
jgi:membrane protein YqaA with SNARE-associated domain